MGIKMSTNIADKVDELSKKIGNLAWTTKGFEDKTYRSFKDLADAIISETSEAKNPEWAYVRGTRLLFPDRGEVTLETYVPTAKQGVAILQNSPELLETYPRAMAILASKAVGISRIRIPPVSLEELRDKERMSWTFNPDWKFPYLCYVAKLEYQKVLGEFGAKCTRAH